MVQAHEQDDQKKEKELKFDAGRYLGRLDNKFNDALKVGVVQPDQRAAWTEGLKHCGQQVEAADTPEAKADALKKAIAEAHSLLNILDGMTKEAKDKNLDEETFKDLSSSGWLSPIEHARYWSAYQSAEKKEDKAGLLSEMQNARAGAKEIHDREWQPLAESKIAREPEHQNLLKEFEAKFWAATTTEKKDIVLKFEQALAEQTKQQEKLESKVEAAEDTAESANDSNFEQPAEQPQSTHESLDQRLEKAETKQHVNLTEQVEQGDALTHTPNEKWIETFKKIDESTEYTTAEKKIKDLEASESKTDTQAVDDYQAMASQREVHQEEMDSGASLTDRFKSMLGFSSEMAKTSAPANDAEEQETPEEQRAGKAIEEIGLKQRDQLIDPLTKDLGITNIQDFQKEKLAKVLLTEKDAEKRKRKIKDVMEGRRVA